MKVPVLTEAPKRGGSDCHYGAEEALDKGMPTSSAPVSLFTPARSLLLRLQDLFDGRELC